MLFKDDVMILCLCSSGTGERGWEVIFSGGRTVGMDEGYGGRYLISGWGGGLMQCSNVWRQYSVFHLKQVQGNESS